MKLAIAVHGPPWNSESSASACRFIHAALDAGHDIVRVFFYHDGARTGDALAVTPQDEASVLDRWVALHDEHGVELAVCIAAALKRGILSTTSTASSWRSASRQL
jgi:tRNA 2-thiouridine synthesizing protein D